MKEQISTEVAEARVLDTSNHEIQKKEEILEKEVTEVEQAAKGIVIKNQADYESASEFLKSVKQTLKKVEGYWEPLRESAYKTYNDILTKKKEMIGPLKSAEKILKSTMGTFLNEQEKKRKAQEEALRKLAQKEVDKKLDDAAKLQEQGDLVGVEYAMTEAEVYDDASVSAVVASKPKNVKGVTTKKDWKIKSIDPNKVPVDISGIVLRPVDEKAVLKLIKSSKGTVKIPGVEYEETISISASSK